MSLLRLLEFNIPNQSPLNYTNCIYCLLFLCSFKEEHYQECVRYKKNIISFISFTFKVKLFSSFYFSFTKFIKLKTTNSFCTRKKKFWMGESERPNRKSKRTNLISTTTSDISISIWPILAIWVLTEPKLNSDSFSSFDQTRNSHKKYFK